MVSIPYWRLSSFYWFYFGTVGAIAPYWTLYLQEKGFSAQMIGQIMAIIMTFKIIAPNFWGWIADYTGQRIFLVRLSSLLATFCFTGIFFVEGFWGMALVLSTFSFFWNATLPQVDATTFVYLGHHSHRYTQIRVWGSVGFIVVSVGLGWFFTTKPITIWFPIVLVGLLISVWAVTLLIPRQTGPFLRVKPESLRQILRQPTVMALFIVCVLMQASHGAYYTFYTIYLEGHGYSRVIIGQLWAFGVVAEVLAFLVMHRVLKRFNLHSLLILSLGLASLRWILIGHYPWLTVLLFAQTLHAASFGLFHAVAIQLVFQYFPGRLQGRGQALYSSFSFGVGSAIGSLSSGYTWETIGAQNSYLIAAIACGVAAWISWLWVRPQRI